ncbi:hypothetical protein [Actinoplanes derwentensis]|uniref:Uncharacterized protein n=2 Tax=Actinoplanes derwentensis TaxID=113562 RepID=A0A1H1ZEU3_9ACTN|nr:hypothetical protein [Actinoplanes derwentensis]SDT31726.1 hypothetical protein SAMN04489716_3264 [Actinoplanes derwentensis]
MITGHVRCAELAMAANRLRLTMLTAKWHGSREECFVFTRVRAALRYFNRREVRQEIDTASDNLMAGADTYATHPASPAAHQAFGFVFDDRGDLKLARRHLERSGDEAIWPWAYFGDSGELFEKARMNALLPPLPRR